MLNNVAVEQVQETKYVGVTLDCELSWSRTGSKDEEEHICSQKMLFFFNTWQPTSDQTGPADPGAVTPTLLLCGRVRGHKNESREASTGTKQSS